MLFLPEVAWVPMRLARSSVTVTVATRSIPNLASTAAIYAVNFDLSYENK